MTSSPSIIVYGWVGDSPFRKKLEYVLRLKNLEYFRVEVPFMMPRPELELLGITYRRCPVLAIGNDVYFDSYLAMVALDERYPQHQLLDHKEAGVQIPLAYFWIERIILGLPDITGPLLDWAGAPDALLKDRSEFVFGDPSIVNLTRMAAGKVAGLSFLRTHLALIETQLASRSSTTHYFLDTSSPTAIDLSLYIILEWFTGIPASSHLFAKETSKYPHIVAYKSSFSAYLDTFEKHEPVFLSGEDAASKILHHPSSRASALRTDETEPLLELFKLGDEVNVMPVDTGKVPQKGSLLAINEEVVAIQVEAKEKGKFCRVFAPRLGFEVAPFKAM